MEMFEFGPAPAALIGAEGKPAFGIYGEALRNVNLKDFDYSVVAPFPMNLTMRTTSYSIKRWQYIGVVNADLVLGMAVVDIGYASSMFAYFYDRAQKKIKDFSKLAPGSGSSKFSFSSVEGITQFLSSKMSLTMDNNIDHGPRHVKLEIPGQLEADLTLDEKGFVPLCAVTQNGLRGYNYCHKAPTLPAKGHVKFQDKTYELHPETAVGTLDWSAGCPARYTFWNWASGSGQLKDGRRVGLNFVSGINERGFTENGYWVGGKPVKTDTMYFQYNPKNMLEPWKITSSDGKVALDFTPENERWENVNAGLILSRFHQPFGTFRGRLEIDGKPTAVELFGFTEEHEAKW